MRRFLLVSFALLAGGALSAPAAQADVDDPIRTECNRIYHCTVYGPDVSVDEILELIDRIRPTGA